MAPHGVPEEFALTTPSDPGAVDWYEGIGQRVEMPPPPAAPFAFHADSVGRWPERRDRGPAHAGRERLAGGVVHGQVGG